MNIRINSQDKEILVQLVNLSFNVEDPLNVYLFRCVKCGNSIAQIQGNISSILPGGNTLNLVTVLQQCQDCRERYTFQTIKSDKKDTKITLSAQEGKITVFHCFKCRTPLLQYRQDVILKLPEFTQVKLPIHIKCFGPMCPIDYQINDIVESAIIN